MDTVRIRNGMTNATEGDILGGFGDLLGNLGVVDLSGGHLLVTEDSPKGMTVQVAGGIAYVPNSNFDELNSDTPRFYPVVSSAEALTIDNNVSGDTRYDIVCVKIDKTMSPDPDADNIATKVVIKGTSGGGVPATPANHYKLAEIRVVNGATEIENSMIVDSRAQALLNLDFVNINPTGAVVGTTDTQTLTNKTISVSDNTLSGMLDWFYPVGTIYETTSTDLDTTTKMGAHFGGTWEVYGAGAVTVAKSADTEFDTIGKTGGAKTHKLLVTEMPSHKHSQARVFNSNGFEVLYKEPVNGWALSDTAGTGATINNGEATGGDGSHNNLQPYIVVYRYRRTA